VRGRWSDPTFAIRHGESQAWGARVGPAPVGRKMEKEEKFREGAKISD
jgi:hypothetical protein